MNRIVPFMIVSFLFLGIENSSGQTLNFSQVLSVSSTTDTVPANKVWKVTSIIPTQSFIQSSNPVQYNLVIDGSTLAVGHSAWGSTALAQNSAAYAGSMSNCVFPIWLPSGTTLATGTGVSRISVIEFTVTP